MKQTLKHASVLDPRLYVSPELLQFELGKIIAPGWQIVGASTGLEKNGDLCVSELAGIPIALIRISSDVIRGFVNACPHRGGPMTSISIRGEPKLRCGYHGWTYDLNGRLINAPKMKQAEGFVPEDTCLTPIDVAVWHGLMFARIGTGIALTELLDGIDAKATADFDRLRHHSRITYEVGANWKIYVDNFLEGYHLPFVHPDLTKVLEIPNYTTELGRWWSLQHSPLPADSGAYAAGEGFYYFVYPNTMLNIMPGRLQTNRVVPSGVDRCKVEFDFYYTPEQVHRAADDARFSDQVQEEDRRICEHVQKSYASSMYKPGRLSPESESAVWHWHNLLRDAYVEIP